jgi:hypothetical protein
VMSAWERMLAERTSVTLQTWIDKPWRVSEPDIDGNVQWGVTHLLLAMHPDLDEKGEVSTIMSCITDIR